MRWTILALLRIDFSLSPFLCVGKNEHGEYEVSSGQAIISVPPSIIALQREENYREFQSQTVLPVRYPVSHGVSAALSFTALKDLVNQLAFFYCTWSSFLNPPHALD